jgi:hypothetical protein
MPIHRGGREVRQNPIRLGNLLAEADEALARREDADDGVVECLDPFRRLPDDGAFWRNPGDGLALFANASTHRIFRLPIAPEQLVVVGDRFHLKPLIPLLTDNGRFFVLALSRNRVRLFEATRFTMRELDTSDVPESLADVVGYDWEQRSLQFHSSTPSGTGQRSAEFHGHGVGQDDVDAEEAQFLKRVARTVEAMIADPSSMLVIAAVDELVGEFAKHSRHTAIAKRPVLGNPDELTADELREAAWRAAEPEFLERRRVASDRTRERLATGGAIDSLEDVVVAAADGRVDDLFCAGDVIRWGRYRSDGRRVEIHGRPEPSDEDLLNRAAVETLAHDGTVFVLPSAEVPSDSSPVAASLRY